MTLSLALWYEALGWYNGTVLEKFKSLQQGHRIKLALEILCCSLVVPMALGGMVLATLHQASAHLGGRSIGSGELLSAAGVVL